MGIKTVRHPPYSPDIAPRDFWSFPKLRGCRYETIEEMKEAMTKVIDTLTQEIGALVLVHFSLQYTFYLLSQYEKMWRDMDEEISQKIRLG